MDIVRIIPVNKGELLLYNKNCGRGGSDIVHLDRNHLDNMFELATEVPIRDMPFETTTESLKVTKGENGEYIVKGNDKFELLQSTDEYTTVYLLYKHNMFGFIRMCDRDISHFYGAHEYLVTNSGGEYMVNVGSKYISMFSLLYFIIDKNDIYNRYGFFTNEIRADEILHTHIGVYNYFDAFRELCCRYQVTGSEREYNYTIAGDKHFKLKCLEVLGDEEKGKYSCEVYVDNINNNVVFVAKELSGQNTSLARCIKECMRTVRYKDFYKIKDAMNEGGKIVKVVLTSDNRYKYIIDNFNKIQSRFNSADLLKDVAVASDWWYKQVRMWERHLKN